MRLQRSAGKCHGNHNDSALPRGKHDREGGRRWRAHSLVDSAGAELSGAGEVFLESGFQKKAWLRVEALKSTKCDLYMTDSLEVLKISVELLIGFRNTHTYTQGHNTGSNTTE